MVTCTSTVRHGNTHLVVTGEGPDRNTALLAAIAATDIGYRPSAANTRAAVDVLAQFEAGARPTGSAYLPSSTGYAYLSLTPTGFRIEIGWADYSFTTTEEN